MNLTTRDRCPHGGVPPGYIEIGEPAHLRTYLADLWAKRDFIVHLPLGRLRVQTYNTVLGGLWHLLNPLLNAMIYYVVFGILFRAAGRVPDYLPFLLVGMFAFVYTSRTVTAGAQAITANSGLLSQMTFPRAALPLAAAIGEGITHALALLALLGILITLGQPPRMTWLLLPIVVFLQSGFNLGLAFLLARVGFSLQDIQKLLPHMLRFWMYASGLFFTVDFVTQRVGTESFLVDLFRINPAYAFMSLTRGILLDSHHAPADLWTYAAAWAVICLMAGFAFFRSREVDYSNG